MEAIEGQFEEIPPGISLPAKKPRSIPAGAKALTVTTFEQRVSRGPLPDPETLARYDEIVPGAARELIEGFVRTNRLREQRERAAQKESLILLWSEVIAKHTGQLSALAIALSAIFFGTNAAALTAIAAVGLSFAYGKFADVKEVAKPLLPKDKTKDELGEAPQSET